MKTEATLQVTTAASTTRMPAISLAGGAGGDDEGAHQCQHQTQHLGGGDLFLQVEGSEDGDPHWCHELTREAIEAPVREIPSWMRKMVRK